MENEEEGNFALSSRRINGRARRCEIFIRFPWEEISGERKGKATATIVD